jgi:hypothetical protein
MTTDEAHARLDKFAAQVPDDLITFGVALEDAGFGPWDTGWPYFLEKPWKWVDEYAAWVNCGSPVNLADGWAAFAESLARLA